MGSRRVLSWLIVICCVFSMAFVAGRCLAAEPALYVPDEAEVLEPAPSPERPVCPEPPESAAEGADASVLEQRAARIEADESCRVYADRLDTLSQRLWWIVSEQLRQHQQGERMVEGIEGDESATHAIYPLIDQLDEIVAPGTGLGVKIVGQENGPIETRSAAGGETESVEGAEGVEEATEGVEASIDAGAEATRSALWYLIGLAAGAFVGYVFYRQVMPRA
jgi:hypothetical protein